MDETNVINLSKYRRNLLENSESKEATRGQEADVGVIFGEALRRNIAHKKKLERERNLYNEKLKQQLNLKRKKSDTY